MPIKSYIAIPKNGQKDQLQLELSSVQHCQVIPSENKDLIVVLTEAPDKHQDKELHEQLLGLRNLQALTLVSAFNDQNDTNIN